MSNDLLDLTAPTPRLRVDAGHSYRMERSCPLVPALRTATARCGLHQTVLAPACPRSSGWLHSADSHRASAGEGRTRRSRNRCEHRPHRRIHPGSPSPHGFTTPQRPRRDGRSRHPRYQRVVRRESPAAGACRPVDLRRELGFSGRKSPYVGDGNNVAVLLARACASRG